MEEHCHLYRCKVMHKRTAPAVHKFVYDFFLFSIDLDWLDSLCAAVPLIGHNLPRPYTFCDRDYFDHDDRSCKAKVKSHLAARGITGVEKVRLLTQLRFFGYIFNPVSFYFCYNAAGEPLCAIAEVTNTFGERKLYDIPPEAIATDGTVTWQAGKYFYISPFVELDAELAFELRFPGPDLFIDIKSQQDSNLILHSLLSGQRLKLDTRALLIETLRLPFITLRTILLIHSNALVLWLKRVPFIAKEENPHLQRNLLRPSTQSASRETTT